MKLKKTSSCHSDKIAYLFFLMTTLDMILRFYSENFSSQILQNLPEIHQLDILKQPEAKLKLNLTQYKVVVISLLGVLKDYF